MDKQVFRLTTMLYLLEGKKELEHYWILCMSTNMYKGDIPCQFM